MENSVRKNITLHKIYQAIQELLNEQGKDISVQDICKRAGIGVGTFYHYYSSKDAALLDISNPIDLYFENTVEPLMMGRSPEDQLKIFFACQAQFIMDFVLENSRIDFLKAIQGNLQHFFSEERLTYTILYQIVDSPSLFSNWKKHYDSENITWHLLYLTRGLIHHWLGSDRTYNLREELWHQVEMTQPFSEE